MDGIFKAGDVVTLKSGGPKMTVSELGDSFGGKPTVWCDWFEGTKKQSSDFLPTSLKLIEPHTY